MMDDDRSQKFEFRSCPKRVEVKIIFSTCAKSLTITNGVQSSNHVTCSVLTLQPSSAALQSLTHSPNER